MRPLRPLSEQERKDLEVALKKTKDASEWRRVFVILSYDEGLSVEELARLTRLSEWTIEEYLKQYSSYNKTSSKKFIHSILVFFSRGAVSFLVADFFGIPTFMPPILVHSRASIFFRDC